MSPPSADIESMEVSQRPEIERANGALFVDIRAKGEIDAEHDGIKLAEDGHTILIPQPSDDPNDPLNWSTLRKSLLFCTMASASFLTDFQAAAGAPLLGPQAKEWGISPNHVNYAGNLNLLMIGIGGLFWLPIMSSWGRAPVLFWVNFVGTCMTLGCCLVENFAGYYGTRAVMGFFFSGSLTVGLAFVQDMYFFHQQARKIGLWTMMLLVAPYTSPVFGYFILADTQKWRTIFWVTFALGSFVVMLSIFFLDETWYRRDIAPASQPSRGNRIFRVIGVWQLQTTPGYFIRPKESLVRLFATLMKPAVFLVMLYYAMNLMWVIGVNQTTGILFGTPHEAGGYGMSTKSAGFCAILPVCSVLVGELVGHWNNEWIARRYIRKHNGLFKPEARLPPIYPAHALMVGGLILLGQALGRHLHIGAVMVGWGFFVFGQMVMTVSLTAYILDAYPTAPGEIASLLNASRILSGFSVGYFQLGWGQSVGWAASFGTQAGISAASLTIIIVLHIWGEKLRARGGPLKI
ncbi:hypothetical protein LTR84_004018 [Exophiala bonariae]|uniref:Major facilitator superfamily (MFS) profile domain-containing protein n=1 Tax=Exophiala bonariae TaxID=1690606 RepID=A0AAV9N5E7_9EURO|nr:hypothetical protein LTR84_004018 [Exophiala bonariae]